LIGPVLGPFDLAALPIGSYTPRIGAKQPVHMGPEEALQGWLDLTGTQGATKELQLPVDGRVRLLVLRHGVM
jgi:hypothetical protein